MEDRPHIRPYAHIIFCDDAHDEEDGERCRTVGQYRSKIFVGPDRPWPLPQLVMVVELVVDQRDELTSASFSFSRNAEVVARGSFDEQLVGVTAGVKVRDAQATRYTMRADLRARDVELYAGDTVTGRVELNGELLNYIALRVESAPSASTEVSLGERLVQRSRIQRKPAIPSLLLLPGTEVDSGAVAAIALAYSHAGMVVSAWGKREDRPEFLFPAIVCSSFAVELFKKSFVVHSQPIADRSLRHYPTGHKLLKLWESIEPVNRQIIAGFFRNSADEPLLTAPEARIEVFEEALTAIGESPFVKWRYAYELDSATMLSHAAVTEVLDALGQSAQYVMSSQSRSSA